MRIKVFEWRPSKDEMFEWAAFNSEYTVGATGKLSLPLIGDVPAAGMSTADLAQSIAERLSKLFPGPRPNELNGLDTHSNLTLQMHHLFAQ